MSIITLIPRINYQRLRFLIGLNLYGFVLLEGLFRAFTPFPIITETGFRVSHEILGSVENSNFPGIDADGFRNIPSAKKIGIVAIGDSSTYGLAASSADSWPQQLARMADKTAYNFGGVGYGPLQYLYLMEKAIDKQPDAIVLGFNLPVELGDICTGMETIPYWVKWAHNKNLDISQCNLEKILEKKYPQKSETKPPKPAEGTIPIFSQVKLFLKKLAIFSAFDYFVYDPFKNWLNKNKKPLDIDFVDGANNMYVSYAYLNKGLKIHLDMDKPKVQTGLRIVKFILKEMVKEARLNNIKFYVLMIPSRISVALPYIEKRGYTPPEVAYIFVRKERELEQILRKFLKSINVKFVSARPNLVWALKNKKNVYPDREDNHPLSIGYQAIAKSAFDAFFSH